MGDLIVTHEGMGLRNEKSVYIEKDSEGRDHYKNRQGKKPDEDSDKYSRDSMYSYIMDIVTGEAIIFQFFPEEFSEDVAATYTTTDIAGRTSPLYGYAHSSGRSIPLELYFCESVEQNDVDTLETPKSFDVEAKVLWLQSLVYADYSVGSGGIPGRQAYIYPPHKVLLKMGKIIEGRICLVESVSVQRKRPYNYHTGKQMLATVNISLKELSGKYIDNFFHPIPLSYEEIRTTRYPVR